MRKGSAWQWVSRNGSGTASPLTLKAIPRTSKKALENQIARKGKFPNGAPAERNLEPKLLAEAFAEMERWSEELRHDPTLAEALESLEGDRQESTSRARRRPSQVRGPSR